jgi:hypothetical protein
MQHVSTVLPLNDGKRALTVMVVDTTAANLELYALIGEVDGFGVPLAYCLLSTATSIAKDKRTQALSAFFSAARDKYNLNPDVIHTDKDMAEVNAAHIVWPSSKHQLCWWHLRKAVRTRLAKNSLSTVPYHPFDAEREFGFIDVEFLPRSKPDLSDKEDDREEVAGTHRTSLAQARRPRAQAPPSGHVPGPTKGPNRITFQLPPSSQPRPSQFTPDSEPSPSQAILHIAGRLRLLAARPNVCVDEQEETVHCEDNVDVRAIFCPEEYRDAIVAMMEKHFCAHPLIPGYCKPSPEGIRWWAVEQMWRFCESHDLPEVWAYMWECWYRPGRWLLWARSQGMVVPRLKTTMVCEAQYVLPLPLSLTRLTHGSQLASRQEGFPSSFPQASRRHTHMDPY